MRFRRDGRKLLKLLGVFTKMEKLKKSEMFLEGLTSWKGSLVRKSSPSVGTYDCGLAGRVC